MISEPSPASRTCSVDNRLTQDPSVVTMVATEREDIVRGFLFTQGNPRVFLKPLDDLVEADLLTEFYIEPETVHVLRRDFDCR